ncbi:MAG: hypothetical protein HWE12_00140 [Oceanospirillaceae bacterium]|nr:hypothetical protein [Oceanospirillaceae bacterium]
MDYFEGILKTVLEQQGYWVRQAFKVELTKEEKRLIGKPSIPRPEVDLLAFKPLEDELLVIEAKSFLDSPGVRVDDLQKSYEIPAGRYKLFTCQNYREIVFGRLLKQLQRQGMITGKTKITLGLAAGKVYRNRSYELQELCDSSNWRFWSPEFIRGEVIRLAEMGYENDPAVITAKILSVK